jgi:hypothetical protein
MINTVEKIYFENQFISYKMTKQDGSIWHVPLDEANTDYQAIQEWISEGNTVIDNGGTE